MSPCLSITVLPAFVLDMWEHERRQDTVLDVEMHQP